MFSKFTEEAQKVLIEAKREMKELKHSYVGSEHLLLSLLRLDNDFINKMKKYNITYDKFKSKLIEFIGIGDASNSLFIYTPLLKRIIETAMLIGRESSNEVNNDCLIYALFEEEEGVAIKILNSLDVNIDNILNDYSYILCNRSKKKNKKLLVEEFGIDLTMLALKGELDPVIGREKEIKRMMEILCRRCKNNPLLIGEAGVGKTSLAEELARMIVSNNVPDKLKNKRIISVSIASLVSGTKYRGEFEERITKMLDELESNPDIFLFIDEIHTIMGAGGAEGAIDAANIFKPSLARGKIRLIGATTLDEYKQTIEKDKAMERRFQTIEVNEPSCEDTYNILNTLKPIYEKYHNVSIEDNLLKEIIKLTNKYIYDRYQPDKSIDILDEVSSKVSLDITKEKSKLNTYKKELKEIKESKNNYLISEDYNNAFLTKIKEKDLLSKINKLENKNKKIKTKKIKLKDIAEVISKKTGIPIYEIDNINTKYISNLDKYLKREIIGQDEAILELTKITKRFKYGYKDNNKPISLLFVGPSGCGKTKLASLYSDYIFGKNKIIRIDGSEYRDSSSINKILGSNAGYIGYSDNKNKLEEIRNNPHSLILFDEIEKANPLVLNLFLQILDEGKITDNKGNIINFSNNIIIMTSNVGYNRDDIGFITNNSNKLKEVFPIEILNRIGKIIYFNKLNYDSINLIINNKLKSLKNRFKKENINIHITDSLIKSLIEKIDYNTYGARKIEYIIEEVIDKYIIDSIIDGKKDIYINN